MRITKTITRMDGYGRVESVTTIEAPSAYELLVTEQELKTGLKVRTGEVTRVDGKVIEDTVDLPIESK